MSLCRDSEQHLRRWCAGIVLHRSHIRITTRLSPNNEFARFVGLQVKVKYVQDAANTPFNMELSLRLKWHVAESGGLN